MTDTQVARVKRVATCTTCQELYIRFAKISCGNFNCDQQPHTCTCLSVSVCLFVSLSACHGFSAMFLLSDLHDSYTRYSSHALIDLYSPLSGCLCVFSSSIYPSFTVFSIMFLLWDLNDSNTRYSCHELLVECAFSVQFHVKVAQVIRRFRSVSSVAPWICDGLASYLAQIQPMRWRWVV